MNTRRLSLLLIACAALIIGCKKNQPAQEQSSIPSNPPAPVVPSAQTIARIHWLGKTQIAADTNSAVLMSVWKLPESTRLETQTLEKLSLAPWTLLHRAAATNLSALLRPLLDDVLQQESCLEIRQTTNEPGQLVFAIRLDDARATLWQTNLAAVFESLTGIQPAPAGGPRAGWSLQKHHAPDLIELTRLNGWILLGAAQDHNALLDELSTRVQEQGAPFAPRTTNFWLEADLDLARVAKAFSFDWPLTPDFPTIYLSEIGEGTNVHTRVELGFSNRLTFTAEPWVIPTNVINAPITSFTAVRGFGTWLDSFKIWNDLNTGPSPNQFFVWSEQGPVMLTYFAAPWPDASNHVEHLVNYVLERAESSWNTNDDFGFVRGQNFHGLEWRGLPFLWPSLRSESFGGNEYAFGGLFPSGQFPDGPHPELPWDILNQTNLVGYSWEMSGPRVAAWVYIAQFFRHVTHRFQLSSNLAALKWLLVIPPKLGRSVTVVTVATPHELRLDRRSTIGFTGIELQLISDWLESAKFPEGLHTWLGPRDTF